MVTDPCTGVRQLMCPRSLSAFPELSVVAVLLDGTDVDLPVFFSPHILHPEENLCGCFQIYVDVFILSGHFPNYVDVFNLIRTFFGRTRNLQMTSETLL